MKARVSWQILNLYRNGAVGFIHWLGVRSVISKRLRPRRHLLVRRGKADATKNRAGAKTIFDVVCWAVASARLDYDGRVAVHERPLLNEWPVLEVFGASAEKANTQNVVDGLAIVVPRAVPLPPD